MADTADFDIDKVNREDDLRIGLPPLPFEPTSSAHLSLPHKYDRNDKFGLWQFEMLKGFGLSPESKILELGPGGGRLAIHLVPFLQPGGYAGLEVSRQGLDWLWDILPPEDRARRPHLFWGGDFAVSELMPWSPDVILAHSVLTHLSWNEIGKCFYELRKVIADDGVFLPSYFRALGSPWEPQSYGKSGKKKSYGHKDPFHYRFEVLEQLAAETGWTAEHKDMTDHHKGQSLLMLRPR